MTSVTQFKGWYLRDVSVCNSFFSNKIHVAFACKRILLNELRGYSISSKRPGVNKHTLTTDRDTCLIELVRRVLKIIMFGNRTICIDIISRNKKVSTQRANNGYQYTKPRNTKYNKDGEILQNK